MCRFCERPCFRDGGEADCQLSDAEYDEAANGPSYVSDEIEDFETALAADAEKLRALGGDPGWEDYELHAGVDYGDTLVEPPEDHDTCPGCGGVHGGGPCPDDGTPLRRRSNASEGK